MDKKDWEKAKERLSLPLGSVKLIADGYTVTLQRVPVKDMFHNAIKVFVNGEFKGKWLLEDCEVRRRFISQKAVPLMSRKEIAAYNKAPKSLQRKFKEMRDARIIQYSSHWTSWNALVKHFEANNQSIQLIDSTEWL